MGGRDRCSARGTRRGAGRMGVGGRDRRTICFIKSIPCVVTDRWIVFVSGVVSCQSDVRIELALGDRGFAGRRRTGRLSSGEFETLAESLSWSQGAIEVPDLIVPWSSIGKKLTYGWSPS